MYKCMLEAKIKLKVNLFVYLWGKDYIFTCGVKIISR
jgi:hypothetical protein